MKTSESKVGSQEATARDLRRQILNVSLLTVVFYVLMASALLLTPGCATTGGPTLPKPIPVELAPAK